MGGWAGGPGPEVHPAVGLRSKGGSCQGTRREACRHAHLQDGAPFAQRRCERLSRQVLSGRSKAGPPPIPAWKNLTLHGEATRAQREGGQGRDGAFQQAPAMLQAVC